MSMLWLKFLKMLQLEDPEKIKSILTQLTSKIDIIEQHINQETDKLSFLSKITPKN